MWTCNSKDNKSINNDVNLRHSPEKFLNHMHSEHSLRAEIVSSRASSFRKMKSSQLSSVGLRISSN